MAKHRKKRERLISTEAAKMAEGIDIPYDASQTTDDEYTLFDFNHGRAFGIASHIGRVNGMQLRKELDNGITIAMGYELKHIDPTRTWVNGQKMKLSAPEDDPDHLFMFYVTRETSREEIHDFLILMTNDFYQRQKKD